MNILQGISFQFIKLTLLFKCLTLLYIHFFAVPIISDLTEFAYLLENTLIKMNFCKVPFPILVVNYKVDLCQVNM